MAYGNNNGGYNNYRPRNPQTAAPRNSGPRGQQRQQQLTTTGPTLFNESAGKFLNFNYWGKFASIEIGVMGPGSPMTWDARKNAQLVKQVIGFGDLSELQDVCEEILDSIKNAGTFTSTAVKIGARQDAIVEINNGSTLGMAPGIYLVIYKNLDSTNRTNNMEFYPFNSSKVIRGYDHNTGSGKEDIAKIGEFKKFYRMVKEAVKAFTLAQAHAIEVVHEGEKLATFRVLSALTAAMGIDMNAEIKATRAGYPSQSGDQKQRPANRSYGAPRSNTFENSNVGQTGGTYQAQQYLASMDEPVDIAINMDELTSVDMSKFS